MRFKEVFKRASSRFTALMILVLLGFLSTGNSYGEKVEPGYSQYPVVLTSVSGMTNDTIHTTRYWSGRIGVDGAQLGSPIPAGAYAVITVDSTYLESFTVPN